MPGQHTEHAFETAIKHCLTAADGYEKCDQTALISAAVMGKIDVHKEVP